MNKGDVCVVILAIVLFTAAVYTWNMIGKTYFVPKKQSEVKIHQGP